MFTTLYISIISTCWTSKCKIDDTFNIPNNQRHPAANKKQGIQIWKNSELIYFPCNLLCTFYTAITICNLKFKGTGSTGILFFSVFSIEMWKSNSTWDSRHQWPYITKVSYLNNRKQEEEKIFSKIVASDKQIGTYT